MLTNIACLIVHYFNYLVVPVIGDATIPDQWIHLVKDIDVVIEAVGGLSDLRTRGLSILLAVSRAAETTRPSHAPKVTYIYTSGIWVHGDSRTDVVTDTTPLNLSIELVEWRSDLEQSVVTNTILNGLVIRPAIVYGRDGGLILGRLFKTASEGHVAWPGTPGGRYALVHTDDLADLYVRAAEKSSLVGGKIFDGANNFTESVDELLAATVKVSGAKGPYEYIKPTDCALVPSLWNIPAHSFPIVLEKAIGATTLARPYLANALLGWQPSKPGLVEGLPIYYAAWKAAQ